jgi:hypothetical protein
MEVNEDYGPDGLSVQILAGRAFVPSTELAAALEGLSSALANEFGEVVGFDYLNPLAPHTGTYGPKEPLSFCVIKVNGCTKCGQNGGTQTGSGGDGGDTIPVTIPIRPF